MDKTELLIKMMPYVSQLVMCAIGVSIAAASYKFFQDKRVRTLIKEFVRTAEKLAETGEIPKCDKKKLVIKLLEMAGIKVTPIVDAFIEAAVKDLDFIKDEVSNAFAKAEAVSGEVS